MAKMPQFVDKVPATPEPSALVIEIRVELARLKSVLDKTRAEKDVEEAHL